MELKEIIPSLIGMAAKFDSLNFAFRAILPFRYVWRRRVSIGPLIYRSTLVTLLILSSALKAQEPVDGGGAEEEKPGEYTDLRSGKSAYRAALLGIIPGAGQIYLGNYAAGITQAALFGSFLTLDKSYTSRWDYILPEERGVEFDPMLAVLADELDRRGFLYLDYPLFSEARLERTLRMIRGQKLYERNPLFEYGPYNRFNFTSANSDLASQSALHVMFYSIYSSYRDGGAYGPYRNENFGTLLAAPFRPKYLTQPDVFLPLLLLLGGGAALGPKAYPVTLVSPGMKNGGHLAFYITGTSLNAAVGEEAFFRGYLNHTMTGSLGPTWGAIASGTIFGAAHYPMTSTPVVQTALGIYLGFMHQRHGFDMGPGIALHFWWDIIALGLEFQRAIEDPNVDQGVAQVHYMPTLFQFRF